MALPTNFGYEAAIQDLDAQIAAAPSDFNLRRKRLALELAAQLAGQGYYQDATTAASSDNGTDIYQVQGSGRGALDRQAYEGTRDSFNARGLLGSSFQQGAYQGEADRIKVAREGLLRQFGGQQEQTVSDQGNLVRQLSGQVGTQRGQYADWRAAQPAPVAPTPVAPEVLPQYQAPKAVTPNAAQSALFKGTPVPGVPKPGAAPRLVAGRVRF